MKKVILGAALAAAVASCQTNGNQNDVIAVSEGEMWVIGCDSTGACTGANRKGNSAIKLTPTDGSAPLYFVVVNDTTLRLVNDSLQETVGSLTYVVSPAQ